MNATTAANVRRVIAGHFGVKLDRVVNDARLRDLGADWLDRLELLIVIEDQVPDVNITDVAADHIETVGDLIRVVEDSTARPEPQCSTLPSWPAGDGQVRFNGDGSTAWHARRGTC